MKVWKDKEGKDVTGKEFVKRWKEGIQQVTPLQQSKVGILGYTVVYLGILWGIIMTIINKQYWLLVILIGSLIISSMQFLGLLQRYILLSKIEKEVKNEIEIN